MAKKNLINADMLLATPRKAVETVAPSVEIPIEVVIQPQQIAVEPENTEPASVSSVKRGLKRHETRATFIVDEALLEKLKAIAYWERLNIKDVINDTLQNYVDAYQTQNGAIKSIPNSRKG